MRNEMGIYFKRIIQHISIIFFPQIRLSDSTTKTIRQEWIGNYASKIWIQRILRFYIRFYHKKKMFINTYLSVISWAQHRSRNIFVIVNALCGIFLFPKPLRVQHFTDFLESQQSNFVINDSHVSSEIREHCSTSRCFLSSSIILRLTFGNHVEMLSRTRMVKLFSLNKIIHSIFFFHFWI